MELNLSFIYSKQSYTGFIQKTLKHSLFPSEMPRRAELEDPCRQGHHESRSRQSEHPRGARHRGSSTARRSAQRGPRLHNGRIRLHRSSHALAFDEGLDLKWIPQGRVSRPIFISIFKLCKLEDHLLLALVRHCPNTLLRRILGRQRLM